MQVLRVIGVVVGILGFFFVLLPISFPIISALWKKYERWLRKFEARLDKWAEE